MANLVLWRHAEAEVESLSGKDIDRVLTKRGRKDAEKMAAWLHRHLPVNVDLFSSPALRCMETVNALAHLRHQEISIEACLGLEHPVEKMVKKFANSDPNKTFLLVGHQPNLGLFIHEVLGLNDQACVVKKGAVWWLKQRMVSEGDASVLQTYLYTVQTPNCL